MMLVLKEVVAPAPTDIGLLGGKAVILQAQFVAHLVEQLFRFVGHDVTSDWRAKMTRSR